MKTWLVAAFLLMGGAAAAQTVTPNSHAPEQSTQNFPQGEPSARTDSLKRKLAKGEENLTPDSTGRVRKSGTMKSRAKRTRKSTSVRRPQQSGS